MCFKRNIPTMMASPLIILFILVSAAAAAKESSREERELHPDDKKTIDGIRIQLNNLQKSLENRQWFGNFVASNMKIGSVYTRWGRSKCQKSSELVYKGRAAGSYIGHPGAASNTLCLPHQPEWDKYKDGNQHASAYLYGAEYETQFSNSPYNGKEGFGIPCAVCRTLGRPNVYMIAAKKTCNKGWTKEYSGYLMAGYHNHKSSTEYLCMDKHPTKLQPATNKDQRLFYPVEAQCGTLPCPPYHQGRELTCAVCSM